MNTFISTISTFKKTILLLCCVSVISLTLFCSSAFAAPLHQVTGPNSNTNASIDSTIVQTKTPLSIHSNALLHDVRKGTMANSHMYNLFSNQDNENKQDSQIASLNTDADSDVIGYIQYDTECVDYTNVNHFVNAINKASKANVYFNEDITLNFSINIKNNATITIHLCGHVLSGKNITLYSDEDGNVIEVGSAATLTIIGSEDDDQASQAHTLNGFDKEGNKKQYTDVCGGVINAGKDDKVIGIKISGDNSTVSLISTTIFGCANTSRNGGGIRIQGKKTTLKFDTSHIQHCKARGGGGIDVSKDNTCISLDHSSIDNNCATNSGGGILCNAKDITIENKAYNSEDESARSAISYNHAKGDGGGINCGGDRLKVYNIDFCNNEADNGGGAYINSEDNTFNGCTFTGNTSEQAGSALYDDDDDNTLINCTITENNSKSKEGAIYVDDRVDINLIGFVNISNNTGNDVYLAEAGWWRAYIMINPNKFDMQSSVGVFIEDIDDEAIFAKTIKGTGGFPISAKNCFYINNGSYSVARDENDKTRLIVVKA